MSTEKLTPNHPSYVVEVGDLKTWQDFFLSIWGIIFPNYSKSISKNSKDAGCLNGPAFFAPTPSPPCTDWENMCGTLIHTLQMVTYNIDGEGKG